MGSFELGTDGPGAIVVGVDGSSAGFGHRIAGSLAVRLVRLGKWPVTVVP
ncbi:MAG TPA: hypothetical protein VFW27_30850 [Actinoplanes sp.]|jgi:nucleotide-binding universal stress UspA family protein|nr:hypothetical protein [Actinoplanes sp.]